VGSKRKRFNKANEESLALAPTKSLEELEVDTTKSVEI
jgi:hypothetical protein